MYPPARWCPLCTAASTLTEDMWQQLETGTTEVVCANCCRVPRLWLKEEPR